MTEENEVVRLSPPPLHVLLGDRDAIEEAKKRGVKYDPEVDLNG